MTNAMKNMMIKSQVAMTDHVVATNKLLNSRSMNTKKNPTF